MGIKVENDILNDIRLALQQEDKNAVRFELSGFGWSGPTFEVVLYEHRGEDFVFEVEGVKFVTEKDFAHLIKDPEIIKMDGEFQIKSTGCCGQ